jgi:hypothetical protein
MFPVETIVKLRQRFVPVAILFAAAAACRGVGIIVWGPPPPPPPPPITVSIPGPFTTDQYTPVTIQLDTNDSVGNPVFYTASASNGRVEIQGYSMTYTPDTNRLFQGDTITFNASETQITYGVYISHVVFTGNITVLPTQPIISFTLSPAVNLPGAVNPVVICASNNQQVLVEFDDSGTGMVSTNPFPLSESWYEGTNCILTDARSGSILESLGSHTITMTATDFVVTNSGSETFDVITLGSAVTNLENYVAQSGVSQKNEQQLQRILFKASVWLDKGKERRAYIELFDLQKKLQSRHDLVSPELATNLVTGAQEIMDKLSTAK